MIIKEYIAHTVREALLKLLQAKNIPMELSPAIKVEYPKEEKFGDYATPIAMECAKILRMSPMQIGEEIKQHIDTQIFERIDVVKPGFINLFLSLPFLLKRLEEIVTVKDEYGKNKKQNPKKINLEFVSANPTGPLNVVSARAAAVGDTLANLLQASGDVVHREFYVNDYGNQVWWLGKSVWVRYRQMLGQDVPFPEEGYHGEYVKDIARYIHENFSQELSHIKDEDEIINFCARKAIEYNVASQKEDLDRFNVHFDTWFHESTLHQTGKVMEVFNYLESLGVIRDEDGKKVFVSTRFGDDKDRVVVRDDGRPTYLMADIAYHRTKIERGYDLIIDIWGPDHHGYIARLVGAMKAMGYDEKHFRILISQQVNLLMNGEAVKMSKRLGTFSTMRDLIEEIGTDVARYFFVMRSMDSHLDFDIDLAKRQSSENPVFYLQYAHARICSIFREAQNRNIHYNKAIVDVEHYNNPETIALLKLMA
ncbi:MAG: arginine--tRNA ligase, partial [Spirochaetes bacterium]|nr:arginine--tRNA ligase [Spirochaetota bacterium]